MIEKMHVLNEQLASLGFDPHVAPLDFSSKADIKDKVNKSSDELNQNDLDNLLGTSG